MALAVTGDWLAADPHCWRSVDSDYVGPRIKRNIRLVWPQHTDIHFAYSIENGATIEVDETIFAVLQLFDGYHTKEEIISFVKERSNCSQDEAVEAVNDIMQQLNENGFVE